MVRIAIIMGKMHSGGKKNLVMEYYRHIDRDKVQFDFLCDEDSNSIPEEEIVSLGGRVYRIPSYKRVFSNIAAIRRICRENKYQIMHGYNSTVNVISMLAGKMAGVPIRINECISMGHKEDKKNLIKNVLKLFPGLFSTHYMANGEACGKWQFGRKAYEEGKIKVFKSVIDVNINRYDPELRQKTRRELGVEDNLVIGHIGRLTIQKNSLFLIDIFNEIVKREPKARLLLIGDGDMREDVLKRIDGYQLQDKVLYLGRREDVRQFYNAMDAFLLPSLYEGLPVVGLEAECCGLPMFFSTEIQRESSPCDDIGFFVSLKRGAAGWAKLVLSTMKKCGERRDRSEDIIEKGFDSTREGKALTEYYLELLGNSGESIV